MPLSTISNGDSGLTARTVINTAIAAVDTKLTASNNLSDVANAATARSNLGLAIGSAVQAYDAGLAAFAALADSAGALTNDGAGVLSYTAISQGGGGVNDENKIPKFGADGVLVASKQISVQDLAVLGKYSQLKSDSVLFVQVLGELGTLAKATLTANRTWTLPDVTGTVVTTGDTGSVTNTMLSGSIALSKLSITGTPNGTKYLRDDATWQTISGGGDALVANPLSQFAATTSAQLAGVISDETGTGALVFANSPALESPVLGTPTSGTLTNCTGLPVAGITASTSTALGVGSLEIGHASDTTLARSSAGNLTVEGNLLYRAGGSFVGMPVEIQLACSDETTALTTGTAKVTFRMPYAMTLTAVRSSVTTAPTGSTLVVDINEAGVSVLSTKLSIDASEKTSTTAATAAVISDSALADDAEITIDIDQIGSTIAGAGLKVTLIGTRA